MVAFLVNVAFGWNKCFMWMKLTLFYVAFKCYNCCTFQLVKIVCIYCATCCIYCATCFINVATFVAPSVQHVSLYCIQVSLWMQRVAFLFEKSQRMQQGHSLKIRNNVTQNMQQSQNMQQCHSKYATMSQNMQHLLRHYKLFYIIPLRRCTRLCNFRRKNLFINWNI